MWPRPHRIWLGEMCALLGIGFVALGLSCVHTAPSMAPSLRSEEATVLPPPAQGMALRHAAVRVGVLQSVGDAPFVIGVEQGFYLEEGIDLQMVPFDSAARMISPLGSGQLDVGQGAISAGVFNAIARGVAIKAVAGAASSPPGHGNIAYVVRQDLEEQIRTPADLRGRRVGISARGITVETELVELLRHGSLTLADIELVELNFGDQVAALSNRAIDLASITEPTTTLAVDRGLGKVWVRSDEIIPYHQIAVLWYSPDFTKQLDVAQRFMVAALRAIRIYNDAFFKSDPRAREIAIAALIKHTPVKDPSLYNRMTFQGYDPDGRINRESIARDQEYFLAAGLQQVALDLDQLIDARFAEHAVQVLGPYQRARGIE